MSQNASEKHEIHCTCNGFPLVLKHIILSDSTGDKIDGQLWLCPLNYYKPSSKNTLAQAMTVHACYKRKQISEAQAQGIYGDNMLLMKMSMHCTSV